MYLYHKKRTNIKKKIRDYSSLYPCQERELIKINLKLIKSILNIQYKPHREQRSWRILLL